MTMSSHYFTKAAMPCTLSYPKSTILVRQPSDFTDFGQSVQADVAGTGFGVAGVNTAEGDVAPRAGRPGKAYAFRGLLLTKEGPDNIRFRRDFDAAWRERFPRARPRPCQE